MVQTCLIGIDTGGTCTDAAVISAETRQVIATAKAVTTRGDFAIGAGEAMGRVLAALPEGVTARDVSLVSVSTTLATNAVVEGHGDPVAAVLIGFDQAMVERSGVARVFPGQPLILIAGGHDHMGEACAPLDSAALEQAVHLHGPHVAAFAVASAFAVRNPAHELQAGALISRLSGKPVTLSTELSSALDAPRRALTAILNARLIGRISMLVAAVERAMAAHGIAAPLMIVKGDGSLGRAQGVAHRPIETVLSGPAASLIGAQWLSGQSDFIMSDMGGTTTDICLLEGGRPRLSDEGAEVGGWRTMVRAIDVRTIGLGGDSEVMLSSAGAVSVGPRRIIPLSLLASRFDEVQGLLEADATDTDITGQHGRLVLLPFGAAGAISTLQGLSGREAELYAQVRVRPRSLRKIAANSMGQRALLSLSRKGLVQIAGFTPTDAAHVLGLQANWSREAARCGALILARQRSLSGQAGQTAETVAQDVWSETVRQSARIVLETALGFSAPDNVLMDAVCSGAGRLGQARVQISPRLPIVVVGGPAKVFYDAVATRLACSVIYPEHWDVANAVGAATGLVRRTLDVTVEGNGQGLFIVTTPAGPERFASGAQAMAHAQTVAAREARAQVLAMGALEPDISLSIERYYLPDNQTDEGILKAVIRADAVGQPAGLGSAVARAD